MRIILIVMTVHQNRYIRNKSNNTVYNFLINLLDFIIFALKVIHVYCICMVEIHVIVGYCTSLPNSVFIDITLVA